jgi:hypothetical protein
MLTKYSGPPWNGARDPWGRSVDPPTGALVVLSVLLVTLPPSHLKFNAMEAAGRQPSMLHTVGCPKIPPSAVDLLGALEGQPQIPRRGVPTFG